MFSLRSMSLVAPSHIVIAVLQIQSILHWPICNVLPQFNVSGINSSLLCNNVLIHWCWLLLLLLAGYCQRVELVTFGFFPHSAVVYHYTNQCCNNEWNSTRDNCRDGIAGWASARDNVCFIARTCICEYIQQQLIVIHNINTFARVHVGGVTPSLGNFSYAPEHQVYPPNQKTCLPPLMESVM